MLYAPYPPRTAGRNATAADGRGSRGLYGQEFLLNNLCLHRGLLSCTKGLDQGSQDGISDDRKR